MQLKASDLPRWKEIASYLIFIAVLLGMIFNNQLGISGGRLPSWARSSIWSWAFFPSGRHLPA